MTEPSDDERTILLKAYANPELSTDDIADAVGRSTSFVEDVLDRFAEDERVNAITETDWDDPNRCPFCGASLPDGGPGFIDHVDTSEECAAEFAVWREQIAGDIGGEWMG